MDLRVFFKDKLLERKMSARSLYQLALCLIISAQGKMLIYFTCPVKFVLLVQTEEAFRKVSENSMKVYL